MGRLRLDQVTKHYGDLVAVEDMTIDVEDGEFVSLVGPSGCGKSTTLEMIGGLTTATSGSVHIAGEDVTDLAPKDRNVAMVFQNIALFPHLDVYDNISYGLRIRGFDEEEIDDRVHEAVNILQLDGMLDRMPAELSGGQRQRVAIGRAIVRDPAVFLMDEPLANLDAKLRVHMRTELQRIQRQLDVTTVYVTHDQEEAMTMSDRIAVLSGGELQQIASPTTCYEEPANLFVAGFIGSPSMNFFDGAIEDSTVLTDLVDLGEFDAGQEAGHDGAAVQVGIRPEDVYFAETAEDAGATDPSSPIPVTIDVLEPVGHETFVYFRTEGELPPDTVGEGSLGGADQLLMRTEADIEVAEGEEIEVAFDRASVHLFDASSGEAIAHGLGRNTERSIET